MQKFLISLLAAVALVGALPLPAGASSIVSNQLFGQAAGFNVFVFGGINVANSDIHGPVAVGGNATLTSYTVSSVSFGGSLYVGGDVNWTTSGSVNYGNGDIIYGGGLNVSGSVTRNSDIYANPFPIDFAGTETLVQANSTYWSGLAETGSQSLNGGELNLSATQDGLNVFNLDGDALFGNSSFLYDLNISSNGYGNVTTLINVSGGLGSSLFINNQGFDLLDGLTAGNVLFNFYEATDEVDLRGVGFQGSLVAAYGDVNVDLDNGNFDGQIIAQNLGIDGNPATGQVHLPLFQGDLPTDPVLNTVPVPAAVWLLGAGLAGLVARRRA